MLPDALEHDWKQAAGRWGRRPGGYGRSPSEYLELEAEKTWPSWETHDRIGRMFGWAQTFAGARSGCIDADPGNS
jgi:hypothetical protein